MSKLSAFFHRSGIAVATFLFVLPMTVSAEDFSSVDVSPSGKMAFTAQVGGFASRGNSIDAPPGASITLAWRLPTGWKGCYSNWDTALITASGTKTATIPAIPAYSKGRSFILTCFGVGQAQTLSVKVNIVKPDIVIVGFGGTAIKAMTPAIPAVAASAPGATPVVAAKAAVPAQPIKNTYYNGNGAITFKAILKNTGKAAIPATPPLVVSYQYAQTATTPTKDTVWTEMRAAGLETNYAIAPGAAPNVATYIHGAQPGKSGPWYFRVKADSTGVVDEANEANNVRIIGPYYFVDRPAGQ